MNIKIIKYNFFILYKMTEKIYTYNITIKNSKNEPKIYKIFRKYTSLTNSTKNKDIREKVIDYIKEHKTEILNIPQKHRIGETIKMINETMNIKMSYTGCRSLINKSGINETD